MVQQWAQLRYGVFEEHGYPNDNLLPYFYRHPDGYDAVTSSNDTVIKGDLKRLVNKLLHQLRKSLLLNVVSICFTSFLYLAIKSGSEIFIYIASQHPLYGHAIAFVFETQFDIT